MLSNRISLKHELFGAWCGPIFSVLAFGGWFFLAHWYDPAGAGLSAEELRQWYDGRQFQVILGLSIFCVATAFLTIFSVQLGIWLWRYEGSPLMAISSMLGGFAVVVYVFVSNCLWIGVAYRADTIENPEIMVMINDAAWFSFLVGWVGLTQQMLCVAVVTIRDRRAKPLVPRWVSIASIVGALLVPMANGCAFTMTGAFAWDGLLGFYVPIFIWGIWLDVHAFYMRREIRERLDAERLAEPAAESVIEASERTPVGVAATV
jgi:hypothetical protein